MLDFRLTVWYHGLKATQYFSKFAPESIAVLKKDLTILGLPQPKNQNISLLSHGAVECFWPSGAMNPVLHQNLMAKTAPTPAFHATITRLSILNVTVKETSAFRAPMVKPDFAKPSLKRPYEQRPSAPVPLVSTGQSVDTSRGPQTSYKMRNQNASSHRSHLAHSSPGPSRSFPCDDSPRPSKVAKTHSQGFQLSAKSVNNGHPFEPSGSTNRSQASTSTTPVVRPWSPLRFVTNSASNMNTQRPRTPSNPRSTVAEVEVEVDAFLNNLELQPTMAQREPPRESASLPRKPLFVNDTQSSHNVCHSPRYGSAPSNVRIESQRPTAAVASNEAGQIRSRNTPKPRVIKAPTKSSSSFDFPLRPHPNMRSAPTVAPSLDSASTLRPGRLPMQGMTSDQGSNFHLMPPPPRSGGGRETGASEGRPVATDPAQQLAKDFRARGFNAQTPSDRWSDQGKEGGRGHIGPGEFDRQDRTRVLQLERDLRDLKNVLEEERRSRKEDKELLDVERRRREEAENALADVRRECRQPFVVPSLLDAFVELSKLATRGLKVSGSRVFANPVSGYPSTQDVEDVSRADVNGQDVAASHEERRGVRTRVKLESVDDTGFR